MSFHLSLSTETVMAAYPEKPLIVAPTATVGEVLQLMRAQKTGSVLICDGGKLAGIFTDRDALRWMASQTAGRELAKRADLEIDDRRPYDTPRRDHRGRCNPKDVARRGYRHLPIVDDKSCPSGMATVYGIVHYLVDHFPRRFTRSIRSRAKCPPSVKVPKIHKYIFSILSSLP